MLSLLQGLKYSSPPQGLQNAGIPLTAGALGPYLGEPPPVSEAANGPNSSRSGTPGPPCLGPRCRTPLSICAGAMTTTGQLC